MPRPAQRAAIESILVDTEGRVWIEAVRTTDTVWEVFDPAGRLIGSVPGFEYDGSVAPTVRGNEIAWVRRDSLGVQYVEWGRLSGPGAEVGPSG
jgi:hypothetical protein